MSEEKDSGEVSIASIDWLACPFCGTCNPIRGENTSGDIASLFNFWVECRNEECAAEITAPTELECAKRWNKRTANSGIGEK
jgi:hypothetical protein